MRLLPLLVVPVAAVACAWLYGPAWAVLGALAVGTLVVICLRQRRPTGPSARASRPDGGADPFTLGVLPIADNGCGPADGGGAGCGGGGSGGDGGGGGGD